jgi:hypothetical protein
MNKKIAQLTLMLGFACSSLQPVLAALPLTNQIS